jgi:hypothetical protein
MKTEQSRQVEEGRADRITHRELNPRCRHDECVRARADELTWMGMPRLAVEIRASDLPVRCRREP